MTITIRPEVAADTAAIGDLTIAAFRDARHTSHTEHFIVNALRQTGKLAISLVAEDKGHPVAHVGLSPVTISDGTQGWYGLAPLSVIPDYQNRGIGSQLVTEALAQLRQMGAAGCVVLGEPSYYGRFGFRANPELVLPDVPAPYFQALSFGTSSPRGFVTFDAAFEATR